MEKNILRATSDHVEILTIFKDIQSSNSEILIWQKEDGGRTLAHCLIKRIDQKLGTIVLHPKERIFEETFNKRLSLYFKGTEQSILFKEQIHFASAQMLVLNIPREIRIIDKRGNPRTHYKFDDNNQIFISKFEEGAEHARQYELVLLDLSHGGFSFNLTTQQSGAIKKGDIILVSRIFETEIQNPLSAVVKYTTHTNCRSNGIIRKGIKVGAQFNDPSAKAVISKFLD